MGSSPHPGARIRRRAGIALVALVTLCGCLGVAGGPAWATPHQEEAPEAEDDQVASAVDAGIDFLLEHQGADGGFGEASRATPDAISALAQQGQTSDEWSAREAIDTVSGTQTDAGVSPLDALGALAQQDPSPQVAAYLITRAVMAMGLDPENFDPGGDGQPVDLVHIVAAARRADGSYGNTRDTAEAVLALVQVEKPVNEATVSLLEAAQQRNGGWVVDDEVIDLETTAAVVQALVAVGAPVSGDVPVARALAFVARNQNEDGGWPSVRGGDSEPEPTAAAMAAVRAAGYDPVAACWRAAYGGAASATTYRSPAAAIADTQQADGSLTPAVDAATTTAMGIQGILGRWLPTSRAEPIACGGTDEGGFPVPPSLIVIGVIALVLVAGAVRIIRTSN